MGVKGAVKDAVKGAVKGAKGIFGGIKDAKSDAVNAAIGETAARVIEYALPAALQTSAAGMLPAADGNGLGRTIGESIAKGAVHAMALAMQNAEASVTQAIEHALPVSGVAAHVPPVELYTDVDECSRVRPTLEALSMSLPEAMQAMGDQVVELYAQVIDRGTFEDELCRTVDGDEATKMNMLIDAIPDLVARSTEAAVAVAEILRRKPGGAETPTGRMRVAMYDAAVSAAKPVGGVFWGEYTKSAEDLRNLEVVVRQLRPSGPPTEEERRLVARVREATWSAILEHGPVDVTRLGSRHGVVPLPVLRDFTVQLFPDPVPRASEAENFGLGEWGLLDSLRRLVKFAVERFKNSDPESAAKIHAYAERGRSLGHELLGLYVVRQHVGFERAGTGYALAVATGTLRALPRAREYAHAIRCMLVYVRALLFGAERGDDDGRIDDLVGGLSPKPKGDNKAKAEYMPAVPRACRARPEGHDARTRRLVRDVCAKNEELVEKARARKWLEDTFDKGARNDIPIDELFAMHERLGALAVVTKRVADNVVETLARMHTDADRTVLTVTQRRRLEVLQTRVAEATRASAGDIEDAGAAVSAHLASKAKERAPHGLNAHEFGVAHTAFYVGPTVAYRWPLVDADARAHGSWMGALLAYLAPGPVQSVVEAASDFASRRKVQYRGCEPPGVGYAIYALLPVLDHASAMCKAGASGYASVQQSTLRAIECLLSHRAGG